MKQNKKRLAYACGILVIFFYSFCMADQNQPNEYQCITQFENGTINWSNGNISAIGKASPENNRGSSHEYVLGAARADANRNIIEILKRIKINNTLSVDDYASKNDIILAGMEKTARDASILKLYYTSELSVELIIETSMFGGFLQLVLPKEILQIPKISPEIHEKNIKIPREKLYTGLIIDARGFNIDPVLNPLIINEQGHDIYSSVFISREFAVQKGVCKYLCSMDQALNDPRVGSHPMVFKGLRAERKPNTTIIIRMSDYRLLEKATERHTFLKECRIIIVKSNQ